MLAVSPRGKRRAGCLTGCASGCGALAWRLAAGKICSAPMKHSIRTILAAVALSALALSASLLSPAQAQPNAFQQAALTPEAAANLALFAYNNGRADGMLQAERRCWDLATANAGVRSAGIFCGMVSLANGYVHREQRRMDEKEPMADFERTASIERFLIHGIGRGLEPRTAQLALKEAERGADRIKRALRAAGLKVESE